MQTLKCGNLSNFDPSQFIVVDDGEVIANSCIDGLGVAQMPHFVLRYGLSARKLVPVMDTFRVPNAGVFIYYPKREFKPAKVRVFVEYLKNYLVSIDEHPHRTWADLLKPFEYFN